MLLPLILFPSLFTSLVSAATVSYDWNIEWLTVSPDGRCSRPVIGINGKWPCPAIKANVGDTVSVTVHNKLGNETTSLHFHGLRQSGTNQMDGPVKVTQCPIPPGSSYTYTFAINQPGTYWYHSHAPGQYTDGLRGPLIVHDPFSPYAGQYDDELLITISDWYHDEMPHLLQYYLSPEQDTTGSEPVPYNGLINEATTANFPVKPDKTYFVRIINMAAFSQAYFQIDQHNMTIIEADGVYMQKKEVQTLYIATAQRYGVLLKSKEKKSENFPILVSLDTDRFDHDPDYLNPNVTGYLVYDDKKALPPPPIVQHWSDFDDMSLVPWHMEPQLPEPHRKITLVLNFFTQWDQNRAGFNNISYLAPKVPTLYTALSAPRDLARNPAIYGPNTNAFVLNIGEVVEVTINNQDTGAHPIHLHGHQPQIISRTPGTTAKMKTKRDKRRQHVTHPGPRSFDLDGAHAHARNAPSPLQRDTWLVAPLGQTVIRFRADNPGVWLFHCHMEWHVEAGLTATFIEAPDVLQETQRRIDPSMANICKSQNISTVGNAGGNFKNWLDLSNAPTAPCGGNGTTCSYGAVY